VFVARDTQIISVANIASKLEGVIAADFGPVVNKLVLMLAFEKWAVALIRPEGVPESKVR